MPSTPISEPTFIKSFCWIRKARWGTVGRCTVGLCRAGRGGRTGLADRRLGADKPVQAWVLATPDLIPQIGNGTCEALGILADLNRTLYRISGEVDLLTPQQDRYRIACRADTESAETFAVIGDAVPGSVLNVDIKVSN